MVGLLLMVGEVGKFADPNRLEGIAAQQFHSGQAFRHSHGHRPDDWAAYSYDAVLLLSAALNTSASPAGTQLLTALRRARLDCTGTLVLSFHHATPPPPTALSSPPPHHPVAPSFLSTSSQASRVVWCHWPDRPI